MRISSHRSALSGVVIVALCLGRECPAQHALPLYREIEVQPLVAQIDRLVNATDWLGTPFSAKDREVLMALKRSAGREQEGMRIQEILDRYCLFGVEINPEARVRAAIGAAKPELVEQGWRQFLVKVRNEAGTTAPLRVVSPNAIAVFETQRDSGRERFEFRTVSDKHYAETTEITAAERDQAWLDLQTFDRQPLTETLTGGPLEYRIVQLYSRDAGVRDARFSFDVGQGTQDVGFRSEVNVVFRCLPARPITLRVRDDRGMPTIAAFVIRDSQQRVYPSPAKRLAPDFWFQPQVYRGEGEVVRLPHGDYTIEVSRGPESIPYTRLLTVNDATQEVAFRVDRWIDPSRLGWWSSDHHIHASGCAHYERPTEGVRAEDMIRQVIGEDLKIGANLTWGPGFDYQKQFFCGAVDKASRFPHLLRYDIEISGFGSHRSGHLVLLGLKEQIYPGGSSTGHWPTLGLNALRWAKRQGAVCGPAHSGAGLRVASSDLPNYLVPPYSGIGANEYIVDVTHEVPGRDGATVPAMDFLSTGNTCYVWELNMWYHTLNAGFRPRVSGETDFPCMTGERVGIGRSYVKIEGGLDYDAWCDGIRRGAAYVGDGRSHLMDFRANDVVMGAQKSELRLERPARLHLTVNAAALLPEVQPESLRGLKFNQQPYWHVEKARIGSTREVRVEVIVNGYPVAAQPLLADGRLRDLEFDINIERSSWVALRILPSSHTNPIFVLVDGKPIRASKRSLEWCLAGVDQCWSQKAQFIKADEMDDAIAAYEHARQVYRQRLHECEVE